MAKKQYEIYRIGGDISIEAPKDENRGAFEEFVECRTCKRSILNQKHPLTVTAKRTKADFGSIGTTLDYYWDIGVFVSAGFKAILEEHCGECVEFLPLILASTNRESDQYWQLRIKSIYDKVASPPTRLSPYDFCADCSQPYGIGISGYAREPLSYSLYFERPEAGIPPIGLTFEYFGYQRYRTDYQRLIIVSHELLNILKAKKISGFSALPCFFVDNLIQAGAEDRSQKQINDAELVQLLDGDDI